MADELDRSTVGRSLNVSLNATVKVTAGPLYECLDSYPGAQLIWTSAIATFVFTMPLQVWVLYLGVKKQRAGGGFLSSDLFTLNFSAQEVLSCICFIVFFTGLSLQDKTWIIVAIGLSGTIQIGRPVLLSLTCVERYMAVVHPMLYLKFKSRKYRVVSVGLIWLLFIGFGVFTVLNYPKFPFQFFLAFVFLCLCIMLFCSLAMLKVLRKPKPGERQTEVMNHQKKKAFMAITSILVTVVIGYFPFAISLIFKIDNDSKTFCTFVGIGFCLCIPSVIIHPLLYLSKLGKLPTCRPNCANP